MTLKLRLPQYFLFHLNAEVKELYIAAGIADVALAAMLVFEPIYLYQEVGLSIPLILIFFAAVYACYVLFLPFGGKFTARFGYKRAMALSIFFQLGYWTCLFFALSHPVLLWVAPALYAIEKSLYWPGFHAIVARFANQTQVGREFSMLTAIIQAAQIIGPLLGGVLAQVSGSQNLLVAAGAIYIVALIPLLIHKERYQEKPYSFHDTWNLFGTQMKKSMGYWGFGEELLALTIWPIFMFVVLKGYQEAGIVITIASALSAVISLYVGKLTDGAAKMPMLKFGAIATALGWFVRPLLPGAGGTLAADTGARVGKNVYFIPLSTVTYERAEATDIIPYVIFFEQSLAIGKMLVALIAALLFAATGSFPLLFVLGGLVSLFYILL